jgi:hypothetical protein
MFRVFLVLAFLAAWFLPLIIAVLYKLPHRGSIAVLSLLLGWTGAGWLAALVITVGGAIRATRPPVAREEKSPDPGSAPAYASAASQWPATLATAASSPAGAQYPGPAQQAQYPGPAQYPESAQYPEPAQYPGPAQFTERGQPPERGQATGRAQAQERGQPPAPPSWRDAPH